MSIARQENNSTIGRSDRVSARRPEQGNGKARRTVQSVERSLDILELLSEHAELPLNAIALKTGLNTSTCHHLIMTLVGRGYVAQNPANRSYHLGNRVIALSSARMGHFDLTDIAMPALHRLNDETQETAHLAVMHGNELVTIAKLDSLHTIRVDSGTVGKSSAAHATATGKAILAWLPEKEMKRVINDKGLQRFTENTLTDPADLREDLRHVRRNGYALDNEEFQPGVICIGAAIRDHTGAVKGSISASTPKMRADRKHLALLKGAVRQCAEAISEQFDPLYAGNSAREQSQTSDDCLGSI